MMTNMHAQLSATSPPRDPRVHAAIEKLRSMLTPGEQMIHVACQERLAALSHRRMLVAATTGRLIIFKRGLIGGFSMIDVQWQDVADAAISEGMLPQFFGSKLSARTLTRGFLSVTGLNPNEARQIYVLAQHQEQAWREKNRIRRIEEDRARSGGFQLGGPALGASSGNLSDPQQRLQRAKAMLADGLLSESEFESLKAKILSEL